MGIDAYDNRLGRHLIHGHSSSPSIALIQAQNLAKTLRVEIKTKRNDSRFSSYRRGTIWLAKDWQHKPVFRQVKTLEHELVHALQAQHVVSLELAYAIPANVWRYEVEAYAQGILCMRRLGASAADVEAERKRIPDALWEGYFPVRIFGRKKLRLETLEAIDRLTIGAPHA